MPPETLGDLLQRAAQDGENGLRLLDRRERSTWASWPSIHTAARDVAGALVSRGVKEGHRVALIYPTGLEFFHAFFGITLAGAVPVPLYPPVRLGRLDEYHQRTAEMLRASGAVLVLTNKTLRRLLGPTLEKARPELGCRLLEELPSGLPTTVATGPDDLALVQFSSGTTVQPKPVALSHRAVLAQVDLLNANWPEPEEEGALKPSGVSWLPLYHDMGLIGCVFPAVERPGTLTLLGPEVFVTRPATWLRTISRYRATISVAPNFAYGLCVEKIRDEELEGVDLSTWRVALNGAEPVAPRVLRSFQERFAKWGFRPEALTPVYGLSEATLAVTFSDLHRPFRTVHLDREHLSEGRAQLDPNGQELVSVGCPLPGVDVEIRDSSGHEVREGRVGRVWTKSPSLMTGYLGRPEATAEALREGWLDTGDVGFLREGELFLTGRAKDLLILRGRNHSPVEIEQAMDGVPGVRKGCAVAVSYLPDGGDGEVLLLFVEHRAEVEDAELEAMPAACAEAALSASGLRLDEVHVVAPGTLPRTSSGKLRRQATLFRHQEGALEPPRKVTPLFLAGALARSALAHVRNRRKDEPPT